MKQINCLIIDDEHLARSLLQDYIEKLPHLNLAASCSNCIEAMSILQSHTIDILLIDIQMPEIRGTDFVKSLINKPLVIFTTAYMKYAVESYELQAIDYLLKPIEFNRFIQAINKAQFQLQLLSEKKNLILDEFLVVKANSSLHKIVLKDILYIEGMKEYVMIHTIDGKKLMTLRSLSQLENELKNNFMRIHKSYIVQIIPIKFYNAV